MPPKTAGYARYSFRGKYGTKIDIRRPSYSSESLVWKHHAGGKFASISGWLVDVETVAYVSLIDSISATILASLQLALSEPGYIKNRRKLSKRYRHRNARMSTSPGMLPGIATGVLHSHWRVEADVNNVITFSNPTEYLSDLIEKKKREVEGKILEYFDAEINFFNSFNHNLARLKTVIRNAS